MRTILEDALCHNPTIAQDGTDCKHFVVDFVVELSSDLHKQHRIIVTKKVSKYAEKRINAHFFIGEKLNGENVFQRLKAA